MKVWGLIFREIAGRKSQAILSASGAGVAAALIFGVIFIVNEHQRVAQETFSRSLEQTTRAMDSMKDDYDRIGEQLGYTLRIVSSDQDRAELLDQGWASVPLHHELVERLGSIRPATFRHILPVFRKKVLWTELRRSIYVIAHDGEIDGSAAGITSICPAVPNGYVRIGSELCLEFQLAKGMRIRIFGSDLIIEECSNSVGTSDDISVTFSLHDAKKVFGDHFEINEILAQGFAVTGKRLEKIRAEAFQMLPGTQVIELRSEATGRAKTIEAAQANAMELLSREETELKNLTYRRTRMKSLTATFAIVVAFFWIMAFALINVRERESEIGILRAIGFKSRMIGLLFAGRVAVLGVAGSGAGILISILWCRFLWRDSEYAIISWQLALAIMATAVPLSVVSSLFPALKAASLDPAGEMSKE